MPAGSKMRASVGSDSVLILLYDNLSKLAKCFEKYAKESNHDMTKLPMTMTWEEEEEKWWQEVSLMVA